MNEEELCERARQLLREGRLPRVRSGPLLASFGESGLCGVCGLPMTATDVVYELRFAPDDDRTVRLHFACFTAWDRARIETRCDPFSR